MKKQDEYEASNRHWTDAWYWRVPLKIAAVLAVIDLLWTVFVLLVGWLG